MEHAPHQGEVSQLHPRLATIRTEGEAVMVGVCV